MALVEVVSVEAFAAEDQSIWTRTSLKVTERFKGDAPTRFDITNPGGTLGRRSDFRSDSMSLKPGKSYVLMLEQDAAGNWSAQPHHAYHATTNRQNVGAYFRGKARGKRPKLIAAAVDQVETYQGNSGVPGSKITTTGYVETGAQPTRLIACDGGDPIPYLIDIDPTKLPTGMNQAIRTHMTPQAVR